MIIDQLALYSLIWSSITQTLNSSIAWIIAVNCSEVVVEVVVVVDVVVVVEVGVGDELNCARIMR